MSSKDQKQRIDLEREMLRRGHASHRLLPFVEYTYPRWQSGHHHRLICSRLEAVERGDIKRLIIEAPPRHSKSEIASRRFPAWWIGRNPSHQIITASYNDDIGRDMGRDVRNIVSDQGYSNVFPDVALAADSQAAGRWHTNHGGSYLATGVGGTMTGYGANLLVIDDAVKNREEADSERIRDRIWSWYTSTAYTRLMPGGAVVIMMTRWHEDDLVGRALESEDWERLKLPAIAGDGTDDEVALWPEWYPLERLREIRDVVGPRDWRSLYQQEPRSEEGTYIRREWFADRRPASGPLNVYMASDFAVTEPKEGRDPDYTEHGVFGIDTEGRLHVLAWWHGQTTSDVWVERVIDLILKWKPIAWFGEGGQIRHAIEPFLKRRMRERRANTRVEWLNPVRDKATRGRAFQARAAMGNVVLPQDLWADRLLDQWVGFPGARYDDAFDAISNMCLAIDEAHPAIERPKARRPGPRDYGTGEREEASWKTV